MEKSLIAIYWGFLLLLFMMMDNNKKTDGVLLDADYFIQNLEQPNLCIQAGDLNSNYDGVMFQHGILFAKKCKNIPQQQWHFEGTGKNDSSRLHVQHHHHQKKKKTNQTQLYNITTAAVQISYSEPLNANITGMFTTYWPNPVKLIPCGPESVNGTTYLMKEVKTGGCFQNFGERKKIQAVLCNKNSLSQVWRLILVTYGFVSWSSEEVQPKKIHPPSPPHS